jgi:hypothetical protein
VSFSTRLRRPVERDTQQERATPQAQQADVASGDSRNASASCWLQCIIRLPQCINRLPSVHFSVCLSPVLQLIFAVRDLLAVRIEKFFSVSDVCKISFFWTAIGCIFQCDDSVLLLKIVLSFY